MQTVPRPTVSSKMFNAILDDQEGILSKVDGELVFSDDAPDTWIVVEPSMINFLTVLGEASLASTAQILDTLHGGLAYIATHRQN